MVATARPTTFEDYATEVMELRYSHVVGGRLEKWEDIAHRVVNNVTDQMFTSTDKDYMYKMMADRLFIPGGRILAQAGREYHATDNCFVLRAEDSREGWADLAHKCTMMFMSGGGVGVDYSNIRPFGSQLKRSGGVGSGPCSLITMVDGIAEAVRQGGERRGACYGSLRWSHRDIEHFIGMKVKDGRLKHTNISVQFTPQELNHSYNYPYLDEVFNNTIHNAVKYGDPGFQFDRDNQTLRNACAEIISSKDSDSCCLGSVNFARMKNLKELYDVTFVAVGFLLCNTIYTHKPTARVAQVKEENRRLGLGIMGLGEWFIQRSLPYGFVKEDHYCGVERKGENECISCWMKTWKAASVRGAVYWANKFNITSPIAIRAIAPTGTISIAGGYTTPGIEPVFHTAYKRTFNTLKEREYDSGYEERVTVDPVVYKMHQCGYNIRDIDTAWSLSQSIEGIERRIAFQAFCQQFVDNAISSTVNLPPYKEGSEKAIGKIVRKYVSQLRGITFYPDGRHGYQPVQPVDVDNIELYEMRESESCKGGVCGV